ncbi:Ig-like domain-containing protein [Streptacidiphilus anmyonensis]|uniref:Ig-like domain-containing protein n=1 Tax=Streptacidiphilus anmyonensis TaxID=405782 RepID=UPI0006931E17|nr:Ig-like domain-containing protein [Streptacidiphilus anmyonensis]
MSTLRISRRVALATATLLASGATTMIGATAAHADTQLGTMTATPATGADNDAMSFTTSGACTGGGTNLIMSVSGQGFPATGTQVVGNSPISTYQQTAAGGYVVPLSNTMRYFAQQAGITALSGEYDFTLTCRNAFGASTFGDYVGKIYFTSPTSYTSSNQTATTTTLAVTPANSATAGSAVTLTATVSPAAAGTVQFMDGTTAIGSPVTVANGTATLTTSALTQGAHQLSAAFTSSDPNFGSSTSTATSYTVSPPSAQATTTALAVAPGTSSPAGTSVTLTATVDPSSAAGTITFTDGGTAIGSPVAVSNGTATLTTSTLPQGDHQLAAAFTPTDATKFAASTSASVTYTVSAPTGGGGGGTGGGTGGTATGTENITTTVAPGALVLSVAGSTVALPPLTLNSASTLFATAGPIQTVTVTDTRAGAPGWSLSGQVADFSDGGDTINGENLGWIPRLVNKVDGLNVTLGGAVAPANGVAAGDSGALGLKSSRTLATATGLGTAQLGADLSLVAPTSTKAGTYTAVLTLTAM